MVWFRRNSVWELLFLLVVSVAFIGGVSARDVSLNYTFNTPNNGMVERAVNNAFNLTIGAIWGNITRLEINITGGLNSDPNLFVIGSNKSTADSSFANTSYSVDGNPFSGQTTTITFVNTSGSALVENGTSKN